MFANLTLEDIVGKSSAIENLKRIIKQVAPTKATILITGESGTGKEVVARLIHSLSKRSGEFISINCGAIPRDLIEAELFGFEKGAFTGAVNSYKGKVRLANRGTLFLDEINSLPISAQSKLLRLIDKQEIQVLGGELLNIDVRIIVATNKPLEELVNEGTFREDLYWRLNVIKITIPPLRERPDDILPLAYYFIKKYAQEYNKQVEKLSKRVEEIFLSYTWPGNVRELQNVIEREVIFATTPVIDHIPHYIDEAVRGSIKKTSRKLPPFAEIEKKYLQELAACSSSFTEAEKISGISRATLHRKFKFYGIKFRQSSTGKLKPYPPNK